MPVRSPKEPFTRAAIENSPDEWGGVYLLWRGESILYIGFRPRRRARELELLKEYVDCHRSYPRCNEKR